MGSKVMRIYCTRRTDEASEPLDRTGLALTESRACAVKVTHTSQLSRAEVTFKLHLCYCQVTTMLRPSSTHTDVHKQYIHRSVFPRRYCNAGLMKLMEEMKGAVGGEGEEGDWEDGEDGLVKMMDKMMGSLLFSRDVP